MEKEVKKKNTYKEAQKNNTPKEDNMKKITPMRRGVVFSTRIHTMIVVFEDGTAETMPLKENIKIGDAIEVE